MVMVHLEGERPREPFAHNPGTVMRQGHYGGGDAVALPSPMRLCVSESNFLLFSLRLCASA
jgi:hypothetical protein